MQRFSEPQFPQYNSAAGIASTVATAVKEALESLIVALEAIMASENLAAATVVTAI